jgi:hypothetical protein
VSIFILGNLLPFCRSRHLQGTQKLLLIVLKEQGERGDNEQTNRRSSSGRCLHRKDK